MTKPDATDKRRILLWPFFYCVLPIVAGIGLVLFINQPDDSGNAPGNETHAKSVPSLGSHGRPVAGADNQPAAPADNRADETETEQPSTEDGPDTQPEVINTEREIDIWLSNLATATKAGDRKGVNLYHEMLGKARPHELVNARVENALLDEVNAWVRIQFFNAFHDDTERLDWAMYAYNTRTAKFMGTDAVYSEGEPDELKVYAGTLLESLTRQWRESGSGDTRLMAFVRNVLNAQRPDWLFEAVIGALSGPVVSGHMVNLAQAVEGELEGVLTRRTASREIRDVVFIVYLMTFDPHERALVRVEQAGLWDYASTLPLLYGRRLKPSADGFESVEWILDLKDETAIPDLIGRLLSGSMPVEHKRLLIQRVTDYDVPGGRKMIESGLDRQDENYPDYLTAFGTFARTAKGLQRLTAASDNPDVPTAQGAIEGLRRSRLTAADIELRKVLEQGSNLGVKSQALGALLSRANDTEELLEEYLSENKASSLRAVAVGHIPESDTERLMRVVEEDGSPRVRQAALNRLGAITPENSRMRKELYGFFLKVKSRDNSPVIRSAARKYAEQFKD